ncbi:transposase [Chloroflexota bacterium]
MFEEVSGVIAEAESKTEETRSFIKRVRRITRRKYTPEERVRIILEGFRHEVPIRDLCRREGIRPNVYYSWLRNFMEAGKTRMGRDTVRNATRAEVDSLSERTKDCS